MQLDPQKYEKKLLNELVETKKELALVIEEEKNTIKSDRTNTTESLAPDEIASNLVGIEADVVMQHVLEEKIKNIQEALERIKNKTFGTCITCNNPIDTARLDVFPAAETCISCSKKS